jgi:hypothetical protein
MKKILPKTSTPAMTAESLESSFQKSASAKPTIIIEQKTETIPVEKPAPKIITETIRVVPQRVMEAPNTEGGNKSKRDGRSRISIDIPDELFALIEQNKEDTGQTMTHLVVSLLKKFFAQKTNNS